MKRILIFITLLSTVVVMAADNSQSEKQYQPSEKIPADTAVSFPVDI